MNTPKTETSPCGQTARRIHVAHSQQDGGPLLVTVTAPGVYRLSELQSEAALAFAELHERPVDWPTLVGQRVIQPPAHADDPGIYAATYTLAGV